ncbi:RagB/SusD family nutrient uptake outer membrane protein [Olivibacter sp. SDN3]|uniref:RagB/SusD family nutrient uptake outer membrane protein n=1 Tax=Olivibacter sp. SDN3 TaxID=2764720 RepID=UPI001650D80B|nr:RagB/SusD family nutrient uptake outer membrane protein [Olivibacter sp. SDN3]QNL51035.1 RagB/SusD family nutrient uptake outer membrane protein [Olivibacter sp. SDN3]
MKKIIVLIIVVLYLGFTGCNKSYLEPNPLSFYSTENTFESPEALRNVLVSCEEIMREEYLTTNAPLISELIFSEVMVFGKTDAASPAQNMNLSITPDAQLNDGSYNRIGWYWDESYRTIKNANTVISKIDEPEYTSEEERNALLGTAFFHRAYRYYGLCHQFGDVPLILSLVETPRLDFYSTKREVILRRMKEDLEFAEQWVPVNVDKGAVNRGAVSHLLTKINLSLGLFDDAIQSATNVIDGGVHALMTSRFGIDAGRADKNVTWDLHRAENKALPENREGILLTIDRLNEQGNTSTASQLMYALVPQWHNNIVTPSGNKGTLDRAGIEIDQSSAYGRGVAQGRGTWYSTHMIWNDSGDDYRHAPGNWMRMEDLFYNNQDNQDAYYGEPLQKYSDDGRLLVTDTIRAWFQWPHYKTYIPDFTYEPARGGYTDWYVFRLAETHLLRAEAYTWKGDVLKAAEDINKVRERANADPVGPEMINIGYILDERNRELFYEEPRKTELTRMAYIFAQTGIPAYNGKTYSLSNFSDNNFFYDRIMEKTDFYNKGVRTNYGNEFRMSPYHVLWPVPASTINGNTQGVINQNKGYAGYERNVPPLESIEETIEE